MDKIHILLFYKYTEIKNTELFRENHLNLCKDLGLLGRILVAKEGINGSVSGTSNQVDEYKRKMREIPGFLDIQFKEDIGIMQPFKKMIIKIKPELVRFEQNVKLSNTGKHISPEEFLQVYNEKDVVILDARNDYEWRVGKFKDAVTLPINTFREFPKAVEKLKDKKDKKIVMYCTGGIRCEKASAYLVEQGFKDVSQLDGGILTFGKKYPDSVWEGTCFVFDNRLISPINSDGSAITNCTFCEVSCDLYRNCRNVKCNNFTVICPSCHESFFGCCSNECLNQYKLSVKLKHLNSINNN